MNNTQKNDKSLIPPLKKSRGSLIYPPGYESNIQLKNSNGTPQKQHKTLCFPEPKGSLIYPSEYKNIIKFTNKESFSQPLKRKENDEYNYNLLSPKKQCLEWNFASVVPPESQKKYINMQSSILYLLIEMLFPKLYRS